MIKSMTAYAQYKIKNIDAYWEIKSVNQRYLEICIHVPENFYYIESNIRNCLMKHIKRGKIDCYLKFNSNDKRAYNKLSCNNNLLNNIKEILNIIKKRIDKKYITILNIFDIINYPGMIIEDKNYNNKNNFFLEEMISSLNKTIFIFLKNRAKEGQKIRLVIEKKLQYIDKKIKIIRKNLPNILKSQKKRIEYKIKEIKNKIELSRLEQEIVFMLQKLDIEEEIDRLHFHIEEIFNILKSDKEPTGRQLDFILQELNRESNTLSSKSTDIKIINIAINIKVLIEQIREQVQNIE